MNIITGDITDMRKAKLFERMKSSLFGLVLLSSVASQRDDDRLSPIGARSRGWSETTATRADLIIPQVQQILFIALHGIGRQQRCGGGCWLAQACPVLGVDFRLVGRKGLRPG